MSLKFRIAAGVTAGLLIVSFAFYVASNATPSWGTNTASLVTISIGLWSSCTTIGSTSTCNSLTCPSTTDTTNFCSKIQAAEAFITLACIFSGIAAIGFIVCAVLVGKMSDKVMSIVLIVLKATVSFCVVCGLIGVVVGSIAAQNPSSNANYGLGPGAIVGIIGLIINFVASIASQAVRPQLAKGA